MDQSGEIVDHRTAGDASHLVFTEMRPDVGPDPLNENSFQSFRKERSVTKRADIILRVW